MSNPLFFHPLASSTFVSPFVVLLLVLAPPDASTTFAATALSPSTTRAEQGTSPGNQSIPVVLDQAKRLIETQRADAAVPLLKQFIGASPKPEHLDDAYLLLGAALYHTKEYGEAIRYLNQLLSELPTSDLADRARLMLARAQAGLGNLDLALPVLAEIRSLSSDLETKREALRLTGELQLQKKDHLRAVQAWLEEIELSPDEQAAEIKNRIRELVREQLDRKTLVRLRDTYPKSFPGDIALIRLIELQTAKGEDYLAERNIRLFVQRFPDHEFAAKASDLLASFKAKLRSYQHVIAAVLPLSGKLAPFGAEVLNGIQLALEKGKDSLGLAPIGLIVKDSEADRAAFLNDLADLLFEDRPLAVIGPLLSKNLPVMAELAERTKIPVITPAATFPNVRRLGAYIFSTALTYPLQAKRIADYATGEPGYRRFCILHPDTVYGRELARLFAQEVRRHNGEIVAVESYKEGETDFGPQIKRLKAEDLKKYGLAVPVENGKTVKGAKRVIYTPGFDAVFVPGRSIEVALIAAQLVFHDIKVPLLGTNGWNSPDFVRLADRTVDGGVFVDGFFIDSPLASVQDFVERYQRRFQISPTLFAAQAYEAARLVLEAIRKGAASGEAVRDYLALQQDLPTLAGPAGFDAGGTLNRRVFVIQVKQGRFVQVE
jgi:ABC-type branched-subunit amino acid transport system substrate-binding protein/predicted negative regulator of RcsB-dependent stress response